MNDDKQAHLDRLRKKAQEGGGPEKIARQHQAGKMTARERILALLDEGSFVEMDALARHRSVNFGQAENRPLGDTTTLADPAVCEEIRERAEADALDE